jgi:hypothetical protein
VPGGPQNFCALQHHAPIRSAVGLEAHGGTHASVDPEPRIFGAGPVRRERGRDDQHTFSRSEPDALAFLNECSSDLLLVDSSGSYQTAHVEGTDIELVIARTFLGQGKPLKLSGAALLLHTLWIAEALGRGRTTLWEKKLNEPMRRGCKLVVQCIDPAVLVTVWVHGWGSDHITALTTKVDARQDAGAFPRPVDVTSSESHGLFERRGLAAVPARLGIPLNRQDRRAVHQPDQLHRISDVADLDPPLAHGDRPIRTAWPRHAGIWRSTARVTRHSGALAEPLHVSKMQRTFRTPLGTLTFAGGSETSLHERCRHMPAAFQPQSLPGRASFDPRGRNRESSNRVQLAG